MNVGYKHLEKKLRIKNIQGSLFTLCLGTISIGLLDVISNTG